MEHTSNKLKKIRTSKNITQKQLADMSNVSEISIRKYEAGERIPKIETITKLASSLQVSVNDLLSDVTIATNELGEQLSKWEDSWAKKYIDESELLQYYRLLNQNGQQEAKKRILELSQIDIYKITP